MECFGFPVDSGNTAVDTRREVLPQIKITSPSGGIGGKLKFWSVTSSIYPTYKARHSVILDTDADISLWQLLRENDTGALEDLLLRHPGYVRDVDSTGNGVLHIASKYNAVKIAKILIKHDADVNFQSSPYDVSPLHVAAKQNSVDMCRLLIENGAKVDVRDCKMKSPLHYAARRGNLEAIELLLKLGRCDINMLDEDSLTPLHEAVIQRQTKVIPCLVQCGANLKAEDINKCTPFLYAAAEGMIDIMKLFLETERTGPIPEKTHNGISAKKHKVRYDKQSGDDMIHHTDTEGNSALHLAILNNQAEAVDFLLKTGCDVNGHNDQYLAPLHLAAVCGNVRIIESLVSAGAILDVRDTDFMTPIHRAALFDKSEVIELMMKKGGNINAKTKNQMTPLLTAVWKGHVKTVEFLLSNGAMITETDCKMKTALHFAVEYGHYDILLRLLKHGGLNLLSSLDYVDQTVMHYAAKRGDILILKTLIAHEAALNSRDQDGNTPLHIAAENSRNDAVETLIAASKEELNDGDDDGITPLMKAVLSGNGSTVKLLLSKGADISARDEHSCTALLLAARRGLVKVMEILLENYTDINATDKQKNTALHLACNSGHAPCVALLLKKQAKVTAKNSSGKTPLDLAIDGRHTDVANELLSDDTRWQEIMDVKDNKGNGPMQGLIQKVPEAFLLVMNRCTMGSNHTKDDDEYTVKYNFKYVDPGPNMKKSGWRICKRYYALDTMIKFKREELLSHPLSQHLLMVKWRKFGRFQFYFNLILYIVYLTLQTLYTYVIPKIKTNLLDNVRRCPVYLNDTESKNQTLIDIKVAAGEYSYISVASPYITAMAVILLIFILIFALQQIYNLCTLGWRYFLNPSYIFTIIMLVTTMVYLSTVTFLPCEFEFRAGWISSFVAWIIIMMYLRSVDGIGIYFVMFEEVMFSLLKVSIVLILFLMAFSQATSVTMAQRDGFTESDAVPFNIFAMTLGELNYIDNFAAADNSPFTVDNYILICIFMFVMPIAVMNLLIGVAVGDIEKIQKQAYLTKIEIKVNDLCRAEERMPLYFQRKFYKQFDEAKPNIVRKSWWNRIYRQVTGVDAAVTFVKEDKVDPMKVMMEDIKSEIRKTKSGMSQMQAMLTQTQELMKSLCDQMNVDYKLDNISVLSDRSDLQSRQNL